MLKKLRRKISKGTFNQLAFLWLFILDRRNKITIDKLEKKRVLIADCEKIGNYIFKTPLIRGLKKNGFHVTVMGSYVTRELLEADPYIDEAIITGCYRKKSSDIIKKSLVALKYRGTFSHYIETTGSVYLRELLFMRLLAPVAILGRERKKGVNLKMMNLTIPDQGHHIDNSIELLKQMGIKERREYHLGMGESRKYTNLYKSKPLVLYNGRASVKSRSVSSGDESRLVEALEHLPYITFKKISREDSLHDLTSLMEKADLIITVDTGISHLASALKKPVIIDSYNDSVAPISPMLIKAPFRPGTLSGILESIFLPASENIA